MDILKMKRILEPDKRIGKVTWTWEQERPKRAK